METPAKRSKTKMLYHYYNANCNNFITFCVGIVDAKSNKNDFYIWRCITGPDPEMLLPVRGGGGH